MPRAATSVTIRTETFPVLNFAELIFLAEGSKLEYIYVLLIPTRSKIYNKITQILTG